EKESGVTTFFLTHEIDTGDIIQSASVNIESDETAGDLHDKLMNVGASLLVKTVTAISEGNYQEQSQPQSDVLKHAPKIFKAEIEEKEPGIAAGGFLTDGKTFLKFATKDGFIKLLDIQYEGKKRMLIEDFLRGMRL
ncbi:MAG: methionyl-tRNA formyltransferase, partial [Pedobacter sp.]